MSILEDDCMFGIRQDADSDPLGPTGNGNFSFSPLSAMERVNE